MKNLYFFGKQIENKIIKYSFFRYKRQKKSTLERGKKFKTIQNTLLKPVKNIPTW